MKALAFLLPLLLANGRADAKRAPSSLHAAVATPTGTAIPDGIVVAAESFYDDGKIASGAMGRESPASKPVAITGKTVDVDE